MNMRQGCCVFPADDSGRVLDRLAGLEQVIAPQLIQQALAETGNIQERECPLSYSVMMWIVLAMGIFTDVPIRQVFRESRRFHREDKPPSRSALCRARQRLGSQSVRRLFLLVVCLLGEDDVPGCFYKGYRLMGIDGSVYNIPDTPANERAFGRPAGGSSSDSKGAFPQVGKVSLVELGTHVETAITIRPLDQGESTMAVRLLKHLTPEMLLLLDAGFFGYPLLKQVFATGSQVLARVPSTPNLTPIEHLSDGSYLSKIYPTPNDRKYDRNGTIVRIIRYEIDDPQRVGHKEEHRLLTTLLDEKHHPALELITLYHERWEQELVFDEQKTHQDPRRATKPTHLRSKTPTGVVQELFALSLAHFVVRKVMFDAAVEEGLDPDQLSFSGTIRILRCRLPECLSHSTTAIERWYENLLHEVRQEVLEVRRNRINPRVIKQPRVKWPGKKPEHRQLPPLQKTFTESVVMLM